MKPVPQGLREAVAGAVARSTANPWLRPARLVAYRERITTAVMAAVEPVVSQALSVAHIEGAHQGVAQGRTQALIEAATMLKRHGHRSAVTRLLALADEAVQTPARPQPVNASPAGGPGRTAPESGAVAPEPTGPENGAQRGVQGLQGAIDAASDAERRRRERDAWVGHAPQQADHG